MNRSSRSHAAAASRAFRCRLRITQDSCPSSGLLTLRASRRFGSNNRYPDLGFLSRSPSVRWPFTLANFVECCPNVAPQATDGDQRVRFFTTNPLIWLAPLPGHVSNYVPCSTAGVSAATRASAKPIDRSIGSSHAPSPATARSFRRPPLQPIAAFDAQPRSSIGGNGPGGSYFCL